MKCLNSLERKLTNLERKANRINTIDGKIDNLENKINYSEQHLIVLEKSQGSIYDKLLLVEKKTKRNEGMRLKVETEF